jgi:DNA-binding NarL/FixJ family response regulator
VISVLIADDHGVVREGLRRVIEGESGVSVCAEAADGEEVLLQVERQRPDLVLLDVQMPRLGGLETLGRLRASHPSVKVILLSVRSEASLVRSALALGADGYLEKNIEPAAIGRAVRDVMRGGSCFSPAVQREMVARIRDPGSGGEVFASLSGREREVLRLLAEGLSAKEAAARLGIAPKTCEAHRTSLMRKLGVRKATELVRIALRYGLVEP